jgi:hypothetical protein
MIKKIQLILVLLLVSAVTFAQISELEAFMKQQPQIKEINAIQGNDFFTKTYQIMVRQPLEHNDTTKGFFLQRVFVADKAKESPVVLITEGYGAEYAAIPRYINELCPMLNSNQITVEHRYFGKSWPSQLNWDYLTVVNAAADHHAVVELFRKYYSGKWINTGISKGGQTAAYHRAFYPDDVDVTVAYVAPLNFGVEDGRHEPFIRNVPGTAEQRQKIEDFQTEILKNRDKIMPKLKEYITQKKYTFRITPNEVLDYCVLEYPFALWQWGRLTDKVPSGEVSIDSMFNNLLLVSGPSYFAIEDMEKIKSFFVQAARELGYYGYDTKPFKKYLSIKSAKNYLSKIFLPADLKIKYNKTTAKQVKKFMKKTDEEMLFIYGQWDPWSATAFDVYNPNQVKVVKPGGSHSSRIKNLPPDEQKLVKEKLEKWLGLPVSLN